MRVCEIAPVCNLVHSRGVLHRHGVSDVRKLAVLKDEKVVLFRERCERWPKGCGVEIGVDVDVRLEAADVRSDGVRHGEQLRGGVDVRRHAQVGLLARHALQEPLRARALSHRRTLLVPQPSRSRRRGSRSWRGGTWPGLVGGDERLDARHHLVRDFVVLREHAKHLRDAEHGVQLERVGRQPLRAALLAVDEHHHILHRQPLRLKRIHRLHH
mmetsp:Transcript_26439/g.86717  ORF Transcript_26439/g.86717 Transcript_26439/m.86717 type:complete len:213 (-) Transcript_26439:550-1188(-)